MFPVFQIFQHTLKEILLLQKKKNRISYEPSKLYVFSLPHVFQIKYWNKKLVPIGHFLQYSEFIVAKYLFSFIKENNFSWKQTIKTFSSSHIRK